jgi:hypothetical protein
MGMVRGTVAVDRHAINAIAKADKPDSAAHPQAGKPAGAGPSVAVREKPTVRTDRPSAMSSTSAAASRLPGGTFWLAAAGDHGQQGQGVVVSAAGFGLWPELNGHFQAAAGVGVRGDGGVVGTGYRGDY